MHKLSYIFRNNFGFVTSSSHLFNLDILNEEQIIEDGYSEFYTYDDCILDNVAKNYHDHDIKDILKSKENKMITKGINESYFQDFTNQFKNMKNRDACNDPNLKLQTTFTLTHLNIDRNTWIGYKSYFLFGLEFPRSTLLKEVTKD